MFSNNPTHLIEKNNVSAPKKRKPTLPEKINIIWLGGVIHKIHFKRINEWHQLNPKHTLYIWVEAKFFEYVKSQFKFTKSKIKNIETLNTSPSLKRWINKLILPRNDKLPPNYAAASDAYRFRVLMDNGGGWYFDTDMRPFNLNTKQVDDTYGFLINAYWSEGKFYNSCPNAIAAFPNNYFIKNAIQFFENLAADGNEEAITNMRSNIALIRHSATEMCTGSAILATLTTIQVNGNYICDSKLSLNDPKVGDLIASDFSTEREISWIRNIKTSKALPGIIGDYSGEILLSKDCEIYLYEKIKMTLFARDAANKRLNESCSSSNVGLIKWIEEDLQRYKPLPVKQSTLFHKENFNLCMTRHQFLKLALIIAALWIVYDKYFNERVEAMGKLSPH